MGTGESPCRGKGSTPADQGMAGAGNALLAAETWQGKLLRQCPGCPAREGTQLPAWPVPCSMGSSVPSTAAPYLTPGMLNGQICPQKWVRHCWGATGCQMLQEEQGWLLALPQRSPCSRRGQSPGGEAGGSRPCVPQGAGVWGDWHLPGAKGLW